MKRKIKKPMMRTSSIINNINIFIFGGWAGFGPGNYKGSFLEKLLDLKFEKKNIEQ